MKRIILIGFSLSILFGCSSQKITPKDELIVAINAEPSNLNPLFALDAYSQRIDSLIYDALVRIDHNLKIVPHLAESWTNPTDTTYHFKIRKGVTFHDGSPVTAHSIAQTFEKILDPNIASPFLGSFKNISKIKVVSSHLLEIRLVKPQAGFLTDLTLVKAMPASSDGIVGSGPYKLIKKDAQKIILEKNKNHFLYNPSFNKLIFKIVKDDNTRLLKLKKGEIDLIQNALNGDAILQAQKDPKLALTKSTGLTYAYLGFNLKDKTLKNIKIRQAIAHAINREEIIKHLLQGFATPAKNLLSPLNVYYEEDVATYDYDIAKARNLLKSAGVKLPLELEYKTSTHTESVNIARLISTQLKKIGIRIRIRTHEWGTFFKDIKSGNFQLFSLRWVGVTDPDIYYELFHSSNVPPGRNRVYYSNKRLDKLLERGKTTLNLEKRKKIFSKVQQILAKDLPYVNLWHLSNVAVYTNRLKGFYFHPQSNFTPFLTFSKSE